MLLNDKYGVHTILWTILNTGVRLEFEDEVSFYRYRNS